MHRIEFDIIPITPIFNDGARQGPGANEILRVPSLKGALLWWHRALTGAEHSLNDVRKDADESFGSTEWASKVSFSLHGDLPRGHYPRRPRREAPQEVKEKWNSDWPTGFRYLAYGLEARTFYDPGAQGLILRMETPYDDVLAKTWDSLWLMSHLGGWGGRTRRGLGGFTLSTRSKYDKPGLLADLPEIREPASKTVEDLGNHLVSSLNKAFTFSGSSNRSAVQDGVLSFGNVAVPSYACFRPGFWQARLFELKARSWKMALNELGQLYLGYRHTTTNPNKKGPLLSRDYTEASKYEAGNNAAGSSLAVFGLPLIFNFRNWPYAGASVGVRAKGTGTPKKDSRRASPLFLRIVRSGEKFFGLAHVFKSTYINEPDQHLEFYMKERRTSERPDPSKPTPEDKLRPPSSAFSVDWALMEHFLNWLPKPGVTLYVR